jgi:hypothetical protein
MYLTFYASEVTNQARGVGCDIQLEVVVLVTKQNGYSSSGGGG